MRKMTRRSEREGDKEIKEEESRGKLCNEEREGGCEFFSDQAQVTHKNTNI